MQIELSHAGILAARGGEKILSRQAPCSSMSEADHKSMRNQLLSNLVEEDVARLRPHLEPVRLEKGMALIEVNQPIPYVVFPDSGLGSVIAVSPDGHKGEVGLFGCDGLSGIPLLLGLDRMPIECVIQVGGAGHRVEASVIQEMMHSSRTLRETLLPFVQAFTVQTAHTALTNAKHTVEERLARWLLMCHDRMSDDFLPLTHDFIGLMLTVRRPSVTTALHVIEGLGLIRNTRGSIFIRDRPGLEDFASDTYGVPEAEYERTIGPLRKHVRGHKFSEEGAGRGVAFDRAAAVLAVPWTDGSGGDAEG